MEEFYADHGEYPDRIVLPVGNAGNTAALYKCFRELVKAGAITEDQVPKLTGVQAEGAAPMVEAIEEGYEDTRRWEDVETRATAIRIGNPVNAPKALPGIRETGGTAVAVSDEEITEAQRDIAGEGVGVEPASAASVAGLRKLRRKGEVDSDESVVCLTTGHLLKDPERPPRPGTNRNQSQTAPRPCWTSSKSRRQSRRRFGDRYRRPPTRRWSRRWLPAVSVSRISTGNSGRRSNVGERAASSEALLDSLVETDCAGSPLGIFPSSTQ